MRLLCQKDDRRKKYLKKPYQPKVACYVNAPAAGSIKPVNQTVESHRYSGLACDFTCPCLLSRRKLPRKDGEGCLAFIYIYLSDVAVFADK